MSRKPWMYVREAWRKSEIKASDSDNLEIWIEAIRQAMSDSAENVINGICNIADKHDTLEV